MILYVLSIVILHMHPIILVEHLYYKNFVEENWSKRFTYSRNNWNFL